MHVQTPYYGGSTPYKNYSIPLGYTFPRGSGQNIQLVGLGDIGSNNVGPTILYTLSTLAGSAVGGGAIGFVASKKKQGAIRGASFAMGVAMFADAATMASFGQYGRMTINALLGTIGVGYALHSYAKSRG